MAEHPEEIAAGVRRNMRAAENVDDALLAAVRTICVSCQVPYGEVWKPYGERQSLYLKSAWYSPERDLAEFVAASRKYAFALGVGTPGRVWRSRRQEVIEDLRVSPPDFSRQSIALSEGFRSVVGSPVFCRDELVAVLVFLMFRSRRETFPTLQSVAQAISAELSEHWPDSCTGPHMRQEGLVAA